MRCLFPWNVQDFVTQSFVYLYFIFYNALSDALVAQTVWQYVVMGCVALAFVTVAILDGVEANEHQFDEQDILLMMHLGLTFLPFF